MKVGASHVPTIGVDCFFLTKGGVFRRRRLEHAISDDGEAQLEAARTSGDVVQYLLARCIISRTVFSHMCFRRA